MTTKLQGPLKREIQIGEDAYTLTLSPEGLLLTRKGHRKGTELRWADLVSGDAALAAALEAGAREDAGPAHGSGPGHSSGGGQAGH